jgi:hypothetical protein
MGPTLEPEVEKSAPQEPPARPRRVQVRYKIRDLPPEVRRELDARLAAGPQCSFEELSQWLEHDHGRSISPSALHNYFKNNFDPVLQAVKISTAQSAEIVRVSGGDDEEINLAMFRLTHTALFDLLVELHRSRAMIARMPAVRAHSQSHLQALQHRGDGAAEVSGEVVPQEHEDRAEPKYPTKADLATVTALGRAVAMLTRALVEFKKFREQTRDKLDVKIAATNAKVTAAMRAGGLSPEVEETIRKALMEIKP